MSECDPADHFSHDWKVVSKWEQPKGPDGRPILDGEYRDLECRRCGARHQESRPAKKAKK